MSTLDGRVYSLFGSSGHGLVKMKTAIFDPDATDGALFWKFFIFLLFLVPLRYFWTGLTIV